MFTKTGVGGTDQVWFYDMEADGWSLDDKRQPLLPEEKLGPIPKVDLIEHDHAANNLPDILTSNTQTRDLRPGLGFQRQDAEFICAIWPPVVHTLRAIMARLIVSASA